MGEARPAIYSIAIPQELTKVFGGLALHSDGSVVILWRGPVVVSFEGMAGEHLGDAGVAGPLRLRVQWFPPTTTRVENG